VGDAIGAMHLVTFALVTLTVVTGSLQSIPRSALKLVGGMAVTMPIVVFLTSSLLERSAQSIASKTDVLAQMQLIEEPVKSIVILEGEPNPVPRKPGETVIERVRRRGILRIGFNEDKLPFAYFNFQRDLVGFDINLAHALAKDLDVTLEFVRFDRSTLIEQVRADHFDYVMSGLVGTLERSEAMQHSSSYMDVTLGFVVPDYRVRDFESLDSIRDLKDLKIGFVDLSRGFVSRLRKELPDATLVEIRNNRDYFDDEASSLDALLISAESGSAFTLMYPKHEVVIPEDLEVKLPLFYAVGGNDRESRDLLNHWVELRQKDGTVREYYEHWILGKSRRERKPRWSIIRDVLGWVD
jgi:ABC-type amino acid transport substrate-binding protein